MAKPAKAWVRKVARPTPAVPDDVEAEVSQAATKLIAVLKRRYVKPPPTNPRFGYLTEVSASWHRGYFYFRSVYARPTQFGLTRREAKFARLEHVGQQRFTLAFMGSKSKWLEVGTSTLPECLAMIRDDPRFRP